MNILFLTLLDFNSIDEHNIYTDLLREFTKHGHHVCAISPVERQKKTSTHILNSKNATIVKLKIGNIQKCNIIEKGLSTVLVESSFIKGIKRYLGNIKFDLVLYSTPPITLCRAVEYVKKRDNAKTYLLLKDIFPQNAVDIGMLSKTGIKGVLYKHFRRKEKRLYSISDYIGCMSQANVDYLLKHNLEIELKKVEICPNSIEVIDNGVSDEVKRETRQRYNIPIDKIVFVYGGNLGKPQGIDFLIQCLKTQEKKLNYFFLIVGDGTEYQKIQKYIDIDKPQNIRLMKRLPKEDYDKMISSCDVGLIFLDRHFTIPNFPSRLLAYMQAKIPILAVTDSNTDIGTTITDGNFGWWCKSTSTKMFSELLATLQTDRFVETGERGYQYLKQHYSVQNSYELIIKKISM